VSAEKLIEIVRSLAASLDQIGMTMTIPMYLAKLDFETQVSVALATFLHHLKEELNHSVPLVPQSSTHEAAFDCLSPMRWQMIQKISALKLVTQVVEHSWNDPRFRTEFRTEVPVSIQLPAERSAGGSD